MGIHNCSTSINNYDVWVGKIISYIDIDLAVRYFNTISNIWCHWIHLCYWSVACGDRIVVYEGNSNGAGVVVNAVPSNRVVQAIFVKVFNLNEGPIECIYDKYVVWMCTISAAAKER